MELKTDNAAFEDDWEAETGHICKQVRLALLNNAEKRLVDSNGNVVGRLWEDDDEV